MKSVYNFVVTPVGGRYNNSKKVEGGDLILNTEIYNHQFVNRVAKVISTPIIGDTDIKPGDEIIVHHNVFRRWYNIKGEEKNSKSYFKDNLYFVQMNQVYLYKRNNTWNALEGFTFIKPIEENNDFYFFQKESANVGIVKYTDGSFKKDELIGFNPRMNHEFIIDNELLYKIPNKFIEIKYERQGNEVEYNPSWAQSS